MRRVALLAASVLCLVGVGAGCVPPPSPPDVALIGDSIGYQMMSAGLGPKLIGLNGVVDVYPGVKARDRTDVVKLLATRVHPGGWVVLELGSNDVIDPIDTWPSTITNMLRSVPRDRCVVVVAVHREIPPVAYTLWNGYIRQAMASRTCKAYVDWDWRVRVSRAQQEPELVSADGVHPTDVGLRVLADMIYKARTTGKDQQ